MKDAVEQRNVAAGFHRQKQVARARNRCYSRIDDNNSCAKFARLPKIICSDRRTFCSIGTGNDDHFCFQNVVPWIPGAVDSKRLFIRCCRADHAEASVVIYIRSTQSHPRELAH
jgi:hypothetical protein